MKPTKLKEHLVSVHPQHTSDGLEVFQTKKARFEKSGTLPKLGFVPPQKPCLEASYKVAYRIAKNKKPHTIGESLIKPCALEMVELVCGMEQRKKIEAVPLSNDTIHSRISDMSTNILEQVIAELDSTQFPFSMQLDESTDISQCSQLLVFVRYIHSGTLMKNEIPDIVITHCFLHRHALASRTLPTDLKEIMMTAVKVVNFIRSRALHHRLFKVLCQEMGAEHEVLLYYTEVRWLSRGQVLKRLFELRDEISYFLIERQSSLSKHFDNIEFIHGLAYLTDIFSHLNEINTSIQGREVTIMDASEKINAFVNKVPLWKRRFQSENLANFPTLEHELSKNNTALSSSIQTQICEHLDVLTNSFSNYFDSTYSKAEIWFRNPFLVDLETIDDSDLVKDELIDLRSKEMAHHDFRTKNLIEFWCTLTKAYPRAVSRAMQFLIPFATTYLCESGFSTMVTIKTKSRNRLDIKDDMRVALSNTVPDFKAILQSKQQQMSH
ncbi:protein ZBED8-like [Melanaphis sacchari]|nr:protein ZBED8-like [Melanaphis sacchari]